MFRSAMDEVHRQAVDRRRELLELVEAPLLRTPVETVAPVRDQLPQVADVGAVRPAVALQRRRNPRIRQAAAQDAYLSNSPPAVVWEGFQAEPYVLENHEQIRAVLDAAHRSVFGEGLKDVSSTATADNRMFGLYAGIPALVYGPKSRDIHGFDECVELDSVRRITQSTALFVAQWCGLEAT